jgi:hypothetical protein
MVSVAKIDVDVKMDKDLLVKFLETRIEITKALGYRLLWVHKEETEKGYHFWFAIKEDLSDKELCDLQFLLGDDIVRHQFNLVRLKVGTFREFNALFSKKVKKKVGMFRVLKMLAARFIRLRGFSGGGGRLEEVLVLVLAIFFAVFIIFFLVYFYTYLCHQLGVPLSL